MAQTRPTRPAGLARLLAPLRIVWPTILVCGFVGYVAMQWAVTGGVWLSAPVVAILLALATLASLAVAGLLAFWQTSPRLTRDVTAYLVMFALGFGAVAGVIAHLVDVAAFG